MKHFKNKKRKYQIWTEKDFSKAGEPGWQALRGGGAKRGKRPQQGFNGNWLIG